MLASSSNDKSEETSPIKPQVKAFLASNRELILIVVLTFVFAFLAYSSRWYSLSFSHDSLKINTATNNGFLGDIVFYGWLNGRFLLPLCYLIRGYLEAPFLIGFIGTAYLAVFNYLVIKITGVKKLSLAIILCGLLTVNTSLVQLDATYIKDFDCYTFALLLGALSIYLLNKSKYSFLLSALCILAMLGLYQAYVQVAVCLFLMLIIKQAISQTPIKDIWILTARVLASFVLAAIAYLILIKVMSWLVGLTSTSYNAVGNAKIAILSPNFLDVLTATYLQPLVYLSKPETYLPGVTGSINICILILIIALLLVIILKGKIRKSQAIICLLILFIWPLACNFVSLISDSYNHGLMIYSYYLIYPLAVMLFAKFTEFYPTPSRLSHISLQEHGKSGYRKPALFLACLFEILLMIILGSSIVYSNQVSLKKDLEFQSTLSLMTRIAYSMEDTEGYIPGQTPVILCGELQSNPLLKGNREGLPPYSGTSDRLYSVGLTAETSVTYYESYKLYFDYILGYNANIVNNKNYIIENDLSTYLDKMPTFPQKGYCQLIDGVMIVKLSS